MAEKINGQDFTRTLTGFEEVAIKRAFHTPLDDLEGTLVARALLFISEKRDGMNDADAFRKVMETPLGDIEELFETPSEDDELGKASAKSGTDAGPTS